MYTTDVPSAVAAAQQAAAALGLRADVAVVLQASNRVTVRLLPCNAVARVRVADVAQRANAEFEIEVARQLAEAGGPIAGPDPRAEPRAHERDGYIVTFWTYYEPEPDQDIAPAEYAQALSALHAGMRRLELAAPHFTDRVAEALKLVESRDLTPALINVDRAFLSRALRDLASRIRQHAPAEQLLHGEPHPGNLLRTKSGPRFMDFETCCRGPVEFDLAHAPEEVAEHYPGADHGLLSDCRTLSFALIAAWRWDRDDLFPDGRQWGIEYMSRVRAALTP